MRTKQYRKVVLCSLVTVFVFIYGKLYTQGTNTKLNGTLPAEQGLRTLERRSFSPLVSAEEKTRVALVMGITSKKVVKKRDPTPRERQYLNTTVIRTRFPLMHMLLPSFCATAAATSSATSGEKTQSQGQRFAYSFYLAFDFNDAFFANITYVQRFVQVFHDVMAGMGNCSRLDVSLRFVKCNFSGKPAWAQNEAAMEAYMDRNDYIFRVNDDIRLNTTAWADKFIDTLWNMDPPNVGSTGPIGARKDIFTFEFVHKTHVDIFGQYYPTEFPAWYCDNWMTYVYRPNNSHFTRHVVAKHVMSMGQRYSVKKLNVTMKDIVGRDAAIVQRYIQQKHKNLQSSETVANDRNNSVIAIPMTHFDKKQMVTNLIRNAQIIKTFLPRWQFKVYLRASKLECAKGYHKYIYRDSHWNISYIALSLSLSDFDKGIESIPHKNHSSLQPNSSEHLTNIFILNNSQSQRATNVSKSYLIANSSVNIPSKETPKKNIQDKSKYRTVFGEMDAECYIYNQVLPKLQDLGATILHMPSKNTPNNTHEWQTSIIRDNENVPNLIIVSPHKVLTTPDTELFQSYVDKRESLLLMVT